MQATSLSRLFGVAAIFTSLTTLVGCGSGSDDGPIAGTPQPTQTGVLLDSGLEGVMWRSSGGESGMTDSFGEFEYRPFELVTFSVCGIPLGTVEGAPYVTPVELTNANNPTDQAALNQLVFLQSLDRDADPSNGISIRNTAGCQAQDQTLSFTDPDFSSKVGPVVAALTDPDNQVVSESAALLHFYQTYNSVGCTDNLDFPFPGFPACGGGITYSLKFSDEFDTGSAPSPDTWNIETGYGPENSGWGNNEWQLYTDSADNVRVEDDNLVIQARCPVEPCGVRDGTITSARIKPPVGKGAWPAFWSLGAVFPETPWPRAGEIDFMEMHNAFSNDRTTHFTMHWCDETLVASPDLCSPLLGRVLDSQTRSFAESLGDDYHIFEADWDEQKIVGKIDGITYFTRTIDPATMEEFLNEFFMLLNVAMGGTLGSDNQPPDGTETWPQTMLVDYVRVFEKIGGEEPVPDTVIDFEGAPDSYDFGPGGGFGGGASAVIANPVSGGIDTSPQVARMLKFDAADFGGSTLTLDSPVALPGGRPITMKVWSPRVVNVLLKIEGPLEDEVTVTHGGTGWEELSFDFSAFAGSVEGLTFIFDNGTNGDAENDPDNWTFYFDDIVLPSGGDGGGGSGGLVTDFEQLPETYDFGVDGGFGGGAAQVIANPVTDGNNTSNQVARMLKFNDQPFGGATLALSSTLVVPSGSSFTMKVWSPRVVDVLFKLEGGPDAETTVTHGGSGWETLTFDFTGISGSFTGITFIFDNGTNGDAANDPDNWTFYFDDIFLVVGDGGGTPPPSPDGLVTDFEGPATSYNFGPDGGFEGGFAETVANPFPGGINPSARVARMLKFAGADFAGSTLTFPTPETASPLVVPLGSSFTMKVWAARPVDVLFQPEPQGPGNGVTVAHGGSGWEELTFDFPGLSGNVTGITFIFDNGTVGDAENDPVNWTFYIDDIFLVPPDDGEPPPADDTLTDFEGAGPYVFNDFEGGVGSVIDNPNPGGINTSAKVGQMQKFAGATFAGSTLAVDPPLALAAADSYRMKVFSPREVAVTLKLEPLNQEATATHTGGSNWQELSFDFTGVAGTVNGYTLIFDNGTVGDAEIDPDNWTFQFDDIEQQTGGCGAPPPPVGDLGPLDFEPDGLGAAYAWTVF
ncbi:MAG: glycoside hydrolase family 16 protein, partial [Gammaproteobacteria bacterium]